MDDNHKKYKGIKFLKVEQQFLGAKKLTNQSSKTLSINGDLLIINQKKRNSVRSSVKSSVKSSAKKSMKSPAKKSAKSSIKDSHSMKKKEKNKSKKKRYSDFDILKKLIELQKEQERIIRENKLNNKNDNSANLNIKKSVSSKELNQLRNKIISFIELFEDFFLGLFIDFLAELFTDFAELLTEFLFF